MQEVIVYRNPAEAAVWKSAMNGDLAIMLVPIIVMILVYCIPAKLLLDNMVKRKFRDIANLLLIVATAASGYFTHQYMIHN